MPDTPVDPQLNALEANLQALAPRTPAINRDRLLYLAGRASENRRTAGWRAWAVGSTLAAAALGVALCYKPAPQVVEVEVFRWLPAPASPSDQTASSYSGDVSTPGTEDTRNEPYSQVQLKRLALQFGVDALPQSRASESVDSVPSVQDSSLSAGSPVWWELAHP